MLRNIYFCLGSNSGSRHRILGCATALLDSLLGACGATVRVSSPVESEAMGFRSPNRFVNVGMLATFDPPVDWTVADLEHLLADIQEIERSLSDMPHRNPDGTYRDREIDIDIIAADNFECRTPTLTLPHPRMHERPFVLGPMSQLWPGWEHPALGKSPALLLHNLLKTNKNNVNDIP